MACIKPLPATSGDFCVDPDSSTQTLLVENPDEEKTLAGLVVYYTGDCTSENTLIDVIVAAQEVAIPIIEVVLPTVYEVRAPLRHLDEVACLIVTRCF